MRLLREQWLPLVAYLLAAIAVAVSLWLDRQDRRTMRRGSTTNGTRPHGAKPVPPVSRDV